MIFAVSVNSFLANAQSASGTGVPNPAGTAKMRTRLLTSLTGYEVSDYLKRNDVIFIPVGPTEVNGGNPTDVEYVIPLAYALKLAEKSDGLVLPYLAYFYPGSTTISQGTVWISPSEGLLYLKALTRSLIRQVSGVNYSFHSTTTRFPYSRLNFFLSFSQLSFFVGGT
jgi:creatinine amidohydrolase